MLKQTLLVDASAGMLCILRPRIELDHLRHVGVLLCSNDYNADMLRK